MGFIHQRTTKKKTPEQVRMSLLVTWRGIGLARPTRSVRGCVPQLGSIPHDFAAKNNTLQRRVLFSGDMAGNRSRATYALGQGAGKPSTGRFSYTHPFESLAINRKQKTPSGGWCFLFWLPNRDSNPNKQSQSLSCYRYTIRQCPSNG